MTPMKPYLFAPLAALALSGCITYHTRNDGITRLRIGETGAVGRPRVTPLKVLEDSRCPVGTQCVWAGRVRIAARIQSGADTTNRELTLGEPLAVADGSLKLVEVLPEKKANETLYPDEYRFGFAFTGGR